MRTATTIVLGLSALLLGGILCDAAGPVRWWRQYPVPYLTPKTERPPDEAFLKLVPPLRKTPEFDEASKATGVAIWWADCGPHLFGEQPPTEEDLDRKPVIRAPAGEDEPLILCLWGLRDVGEAVLQASESAFPATIRTVVYAPTMVPGEDPRFAPVKGGRRIWIPTYLPEGDSVEVKAGKNAVFWVTVPVPKGMAPGKHEIALRLILKESKKVATLPVTVEVLPFALPRAKIAYGMYFRPSLKLMKRKEYLTDEMMRAYWRDQARHGMTSATIFNYSRLHDEAGNLNLYGTPIEKNLKMTGFNPTPVGKYLEQMTEEGLVTEDVPVMFLDRGGIQLKHPKVGAILAAFKEEIARRGWPEILYYGLDEPAVNERSLAHFKSIQVVRDRFRIVTAINDYAATAYGDYVDAWVLNAGRTTPEIRELAARKRAEIWNYSCHNRGRGNIPFNRFYAGIYTWALKLKGNFIYAYCESYTWEQNDIEARYCWVLPSLEGPVPSTAWEARREGVEDYRMLALLEELIANDPEGARAREAKAWLEEVRGKVDWYLARDMPPSLYPWNGPEIYPLCPNFEPKELSGVREKAIARIPALLRDAGTRASR